MVASRRPRVEVIRLVSAAAMSPTGSMEVGVVTLRHSATCAGVGATPCGALLEPRRRVRRDPGGWTARTVWHVWRRHVDYCRTCTAICSA